MQILKTILDFILSMSRLFLPGKGKGRRFCGKCGALVGGDGYCRYCDGTNGGRPGDRGSDPGVGETAGSSSGGSPGSTARTESSGEFTNRLIGWAMIGVAVVLSLIDE